MPNVLQNNIKDLNNFNMFKYKMPKVRSEFLKQYINIYFRQYLQKDIFNPQIPEPPITVSPRRQ